MWLTRTVNVSSPSLFELTLLWKGMGSGQGRAYMTHRVTYIKLSAIG